jgi:hypothetical protein
MHNTLSLGRSLHLLRFLLPGRITPGPGVLPAKGKGSGLPGRGVGTLDKALESGAGQAACSNSGWPGYSQRDWGRSVAAEEAGAKSSHLQGITVRMCPFKRG